MSILEKIDMLRIERGWSVNNLAMEAGLTQSTLNNLYARNAEPKMSTLRAVCAAFGITLSEFFSDDSVGGEAAPDLDAQIKERLALLNKAQKKAVLALLRSMN